MVCRRRSNRGTRIRVMVDSGGVCGAGAVGFPDGDLFECAAELQDCGSERVVAVGGDVLDGGDCAC